LPNASHLFLPSQMLINISYQTKERSRGEMNQK